jgi:two-component system sensor histidine kinase PilS (NtrC family)
MSAASIKSSENYPVLSLADKQWRPLHFLNLYRLLLSGLFVSLVFAEVQIKPFGNSNPYLFQIVCLAYLLISLLNGFSIRWRWPGIWFQIHSQIIVDILVIILLIHASGGVSSGVGLLLLIPVAASSILSFGRSSFLFAALASVLLLLDQSYLNLTENISPAYPQTGLLGGVLFLTSLVTNYLVKKTEESVEIASQREIDLANMEQLTRFIMQRMQTAVVVADAKGNVKLINDTAIQLFKTSLSHTGEIHHLSAYSAQLAEMYQNWQQDQQYTTETFTLTDSSSELSPRFAPLGNKANSGAVVFVEDNVELARQAQQLKLASLGRLTASIAHELRNPLASIRHAGELLHESPTLEKADLRLTEIIDKQSVRINGIIGNILDLSRTNQAEQIKINLFDWIQEFVNDYIHLPQERFYLKFESEDISISFDTQHLHQIVNNLIQNALRHTLKDHEHLNPIVISAATEPTSHRAYLEVMNYGESIRKEDIDKIFEPFFTTESTGTGLGLYIARELASSNHAKLDYIDIKQGACFRLTFADPRRNK